MCGPLLSLVIILYAGGCRQLAGYGSSDLFVDEVDSATPPEGGDMPDEGTPGPDDSGADADASEADSRLELDASEDRSTMDVAVSDAPNETMVTEASNDGDAMSDGALTDAGIDVKQGVDAGEGEGGDAGFCDPQPPKSGTNLVTTGDFEAASMPGAGWSGTYGGMFAVSSAHAHCGAQSGAVTSRTAPFHAAEYAIALPEGGTYSYSLWVYQDGTTDLQMGFQWFSSATTCTGGGFGPTTFGTVPAKTWTRLSGTITVTTGCATQYLYIVQQFPNGVGCAMAGSDAGVPCPDFYVDDVYLIQ